jgi:RimJ/RimL family protein N-acetyltransferase
MPSFPSLDEPIAGQGIALRLAAERDIPEILIAHQDDPELYLRLALRRPPSGAELGRRVDDGPADRISGTAIWLTVLERAAAGSHSDDCVGQLDIRSVDWDHGRAEIAMWIAPSVRGRGLGTEALNLAARWLLEACGLHRVQMLIEPGNAAMRAAALSAGFADEGLLRSYLKERGGRVDVSMLSIVAGDLVAL